MKFLSRDDATNVKPTTALEYTFARKSANTVSFIAHQFF